MGAITIPKKVIKSCCGICHGVGHSGLRARRIGFVKYVVCCRIASICLKVAR